VTKAGLSCRPLWACGRFAPDAITNTPDWYDPASWLFLRPQPLVVRVPQLLDELNTILDSTVGLAAIATIRRPDDAQS
jgi:hypothetical protein